MKYILIALLMSTSALANDNYNKARDGLELLSLGKAAGVCGFIHDQLEYAKLIKSKESYRFVMNFLQYESKRLGITIYEYTANCRTKDRQFSLKSRELRGEKSKYVNIGYIF